MVEVKMMLFDAQEIAWFAQFKDAIDKKRNTPPTVVSSPTTVTSEPAPEPVTTNAPGISDIELAQAITKFAQAKGTPAAKEVLAEFGVDKVTKIPTEQRAAFMSKVAL